MGNIVTVKQEDTSDTIRVSPYPLGEAVYNIVNNPAGWSCRSVVLREPGSPKVIDKAEVTISSDQLYFECTLEPEHTRILDAAAYLWVIELENLTVTPKYRKEYHVQLVVESNAAIATDDINNIFAIESIGTLNNDYLDRNVLTFDNTIVLPSPIRKVLLLNEDGDILQTTMTDTTGSVTQLTLYEDCIYDEATQINVVSE
jgi:hypothetical protein